MRLAGFALVGIAALGFCTLLIYPLSSRALTERLEDRSPLEFRFEMYQAGWQMFTEKPLIGWGSETSVQPQIAKRISDFHPDYYLFHNTYLEVVVERGALGLGLYAWLMICFFRPGKLPKNLHQSGSSFLGPQFRNLWPLLLGVYLLNASAVVMNYQFVNGLLFTLAGILSAQAPHRTRLGLLGEQHPNWIRR
jgi:hypothetical protein